MMSKEQNERMTQVGSNTPAGRLLRQYWQPVALAEELDSRRPVRAVRLMGEDFVVFRDGTGNYGMLDRDCPHRGADLAFGRLEPLGLRCAFHGWLFDVHGNCLDTPAEPAGSKLCHKIKQRAYPVVERSGMLFAFVGKGVPPNFPAMDCFIAPPAYTFAFKGLMECNWLQALEVGIDPAHASFLHRFFEDEDVSGSYGKQFRGASANSELAITKVLREYDRPEISVERSDFGLRLTTLRALNAGQTHVRVTNLLFPQAFCIPMSAEMTITQWHVPCDDTHCYWYAIFTSFAEPVDKERMRAQRLALYEEPDYRSRRNKTNDYGFDVEEQLRETYTGMGHDINVHDQWAVESQGPVQDRTREHLGSSDRAIIAYRRLLNEAMDCNERGEPALMMLTADAAQAKTGPIAVDGVAANGEEALYWQKTDKERRQACTWLRDMHAGAGW